MTIGICEKVENALREALLRQRISPSFGRDLSGIIPPLDVKALALAAMAAVLSECEGFQEYDLLKWHGRIQESVDGLPDA